MRWVPVAALSLAAPLAAPWLGELLRAVEALVGGGYVQALAWTLSGIGILAFLGAAVAIRRNRLPRYALLVLALGLVVTQVLLWDRGGTKVQLTERIHLVEYGLIAFLYFEVLRTRYRDALLPVLALCATVLVGLADEWVQWATPARVGDLRDVVLNGWAGVIGTLFGLALVPPRGLSFRPTVATLRAAKRLVLVALLTGAALFDCANQGVVVHDPRAGAFVSAYTPRELVRASESRARRWALEPPGDLRPLAFEDRFLSEAGAHASVRNRAARAGWAAQAVLENRILERWYAPYLEFYRGGARWSPAMQRRLEEEAGAGVDRLARTYRSGVLKERLTPVPRSLLWGMTLLLAGGWWGTLDWLIRWRRTESVNGRRGDHR